MPLPLNMNQTDIIDSINPDKDVDCLTQYNYSKFLLNGESAKILPVTTHTILKIFDSIGLNVQV